MLFLQQMNTPPPASGESSIDILNIIFTIIMLAPLAWGAYQGYAAGLLSEIVGILHFAIAFAISFKVMGLVINLVQIYIFNFNPNLFAQVAFGCAVGGAFGLLATLGKYLKTEIEYDFPGAWDNIIGAVVGFLKYAVALSFFFWFIHGFGSIQPDLKVSFAKMIYDTIEQFAFQLVGATNYDEISAAIKEAL